MPCFQEQVRGLTELHPNISCHAFPVGAQVNIVLLAALAKNLGSTNCFCMWSPSADLKYIFVLCSDYGFVSCISMPLWCVLCFDFPCPHVSSVLLCISLVAVCLPLSVSVFLSVLLPLVTSPGLLHPLSPHLFLVLSLVCVHLVCSCVKLSITLVMLSLITLEVKP